MEHKGLVSRVEEDLERSIALGLWPGGSLPSEQEMARRYGVSRTTIRGALQGLTARGLIVRHPGRVSRTVAMDEALTLESLKLALPEEGRPDPDRRRLLEGYFALKREMAVELLAACCEQANAEDMKHLEGACFALREEAHWREDRRGWVLQEFHLLRLAARTLDRPGHALLIQSLEKAFWGLADKVFPHLQAQAIEQWALFVFGALVDRDAQAVRRELPALLQAVDACLLDQLAPVRKAPTPPESSPASGKEPLSGATCPNRYACRTGLEQPRPEGRPPQEVPAPSGSASVDSAPASSLAPLSPSEFHESCSSPGSVPTPMPPASTGQEPPDGPGWPSTLLMALTPPLPSVVHGLEAAGHPTRPCSEDAWVNWVGSGPRPRRDDGE